LLQRYYSYRTLPFPVSLPGILKLLGLQHYILELTKFAAIPIFFTTRLKQLISFCLGTIFLREFVDLFSTILRKTSTTPNNQVNLWRAMMLKQSGLNYLSLAKQVKC